ncbi:MAG: nucleotidyltransferase [Cyclobacteriaceae bacterium]
MASIFNEDFKEYINLLNKHEVEYMLVGGMAVNLYGYRRATGDMDLFVNPTESNHEKLKRVHFEFGMLMGEMEELENFLSNSEFDVFTFGVSPVQIDIMTACKGLRFAEAYPKSKRVPFENIIINLISNSDLLKAKEASNRKRDQADIEELNKIERKKKD